MNPKLSEWIYSNISEYVMREIVNRDKVPTFYFKSHNIRETI